MFLSNCGDNCFKFILVYFMEKFQVYLQDGALF